MLVRIKLRSNSRYPESIQKKFRFDQEYNQDVIILQQLNKIKRRTKNKKQKSIIVDSKIKSIK